MGGDLGYCVLAALEQSCELVQVLAKEQDSIVGEVGPPSAEPVAESIHGRDLLAPEQLECDALVYCHQPYSLLPLLLLPLNTEQWIQSLHKLLHTLEAVVMGLNGDRVLGLLEPQGQQIGFLGEHAPCFAFHGVRHKLS